ncbi:hypothetical protein SEPCBS57363_002654 [Sporothrix epigloea]|uniref:EGF-like domain-containing protein n=1 Tax=Sporothrix epigloea TaxID=1892477 RepID=A0ABP0DKF0_9PEZI
MPAPHRPPTGSLAASQEANGNSRQNGPANDAGPYRPPPGRAQAPQRPLRPSQVLSNLDITKLQNPVPAVLPDKGSQVSSNAQSDMQSPESKSVPVSNPAKIPTPVPAAVTPPPRRSVNLGPPPLARRGPPSFYTNTSYVSPIPEESPRSQIVHARFGPSRDLPNKWESSSALAAISKCADNTSLIDNNFDGSHKPYNKGHYDDEASNRSVVSSADGSRSDLSPFGEGTKYLAAPFLSCANTGQNSNATSGFSHTADPVIDAYDPMPAKSQLSSGRCLSASPQPLFHNGSNGSTETVPERPLSQFSAIRQAPRPYPDAARKADRGSLTSLPDLIRRATRLAASLDRGRRPASRIDELDMSSGMDDLGRSSGGDNEKLQPGLSDMLAAFPSPAQVNRRSFRQTLREQVGSWPAPLAISKSGRLSSQPTQSGFEHHRNRNKRRCCGLPLWVFVMVVIVTLILIAAAVVIPLEIFVVHKQRHGTNTAMSKCQSQITCGNGGSVVVSTQGVCSCICTNGFGGFDCSIAGDNGCATTKFASAAGTSSPVTLGNALPRLIEQAQQNFSIPLSGMQIVSVFNSSNLSCVAENALVTFDGEAVRQSPSGSTVITTFFANDDDPHDIGVSVDSVAVADVTTTIKASPSKVKRGISTIVTAPAGASSDAGKVLPTQSDKTLMISTQSASSTVSPTTTPTFTTTFTPLHTSGSTAMATGIAAPASTMFEVTEDVLDFARVAVLFILQQDTLEHAELAQSDLQRFFTQASASSLTNGNGVSVEAASNVTIGNSNSINLVQLQVNVANVLRGVGISA